MKNFVLSLLSLFVFSGAFAQKCDDNFYRMEPGSTFHLTYYDKKDKTTARQENVVTDTNENGSTLEATVSTKLFDKKDKLITDGSFLVICEGNGVKVDMNQMIQSMDQLKSMEGMNTEIETDYISLPSDMSVGQVLPDSKTTIKMGSGGISMMSSEVVITDRKVVAQEEIATPAGTFDCYKITYTTNVNMKVMGGGRTMSYPGVNWFARNVGMVKSESYDQKGNLESYTLLTKLE
ncbi:TapB family protein [Tunicatimonas pelagia]|uniref:TapB family protein n=1 Tax=Tunicatimonas pelagia TaxID=931531 RepID=UPI002665C998|nr:hypothetical protein [Tunicatimonas pelagia]WKN41566.1 hypothetical protein P0M28_21255 [Tunicatimonas pelagia]